MNHTLSSVKNLNTRQFWKRSCLSFVPFVADLFWAKKKKKNPEQFMQKKKKKQASKQPTYEGTVLNTDSKANFHSK